MWEGIFEKCSIYGSFVPINLKIEGVKQARYSDQLTDHGTHCGQIRNFYEG